ncbi:MAG TPA: NADP-dependent oxidoreductase [Acidimicrobiales bacterium]|nr:NADP-dependent oxidoreductase [Acidimicrobiales bacterium]
MRACVVTRHGPAEVLEVTADWPDPGAPGEGEVSISVEAAGLNPSDVKIRAGGGPPGAYPGTPYVAGREAAGTVLEVGPGVRGLRPGDPVFAFFRWDARPGGHAERLVVPASMVALRPASVPVTEAAGLPLAGLTAWQALEVLAVPAGERLIVTSGSGGVGHLAVQLAASAGVSVVATTGPANIDFVRSLGADEVVDYHDPDAAERMAGARYLLDSVGGANIAAYQAGMASGGRVAAVAGLPGEPRPDLAMTPIRARPDSDQLSELASRLGRGLSVTVQEVFPLERAADAHELLEGGHVRGKLVIAL